MGFIHTDEIYGFGWSFLDGRSYTHIISDETRNDTSRIIYEKLCALNERDYSVANYMLYRKCYSTYDNSTEAPYCYLWIPTDINNFMIQLEKTQL